jgi:hypothetical protein
MNKQNEALKMAISQFKRIDKEYDCTEIIDICKEALEQPAQEPVAWIIQTQKIDGEPTEPYAMMGKYKYVADTCDFGEPIPLYTHPAPSWQRLSDDEIAKIIGKGAFYEWNDVEFARAIEQELKTKNGFSALKEKNNV